MTRHQGLLIQHNEDGFFWENGPDSGGYFDTLEEIRADIDAYWECDTDPENIYNLPGIRQSIEEDRCR